MRIIRQILENKGHEVYGIGPDRPVLEAIKLMAERGVGALLVLDGEDLVGILSERDYARKVFLRGRSSRDTPVREIMTADVITIGPRETVEYGLGQMNQHRIRHLPVCGEEGEVLGVVSIGDLVEAVIEDQRLEIKSLAEYIAGQA